MESFHSGIPKENSPSESFHSGILEENPTVESFHSAIFLPESGIQEAKSGISDLCKSLCLRAG